MEFGGFIIDGRALSPFPGKERRIEFIGDSITCGYGTGAEKGNEMFKPSTEDSSDAYAAVAADLLGADYITVWDWSFPEFYRKQTGDHESFLSLFTSV